MHASVLAEGGHFNFPAFGDINGGPITPDGEPPSQTVTHVISAFWACCAEEPDVGQFPFKPMPACQGRLQFPAQQVVRSPPLVGPFYPQSSELLLFFCGVV